MFLHSIFKEFHVYEDAKMVSAKSILFALSSFYLQLMWSQRPKPTLTANKEKRLL
jgi:hypothetical protein